MGKLIHGDCLDALRDMDGGSVDLIYADPPFNSGRDFRMDAGAFSDKWGDRDTLEEEANDLANAHPDLWRVIELAEVESRAAACYAIFMASRLLEMHRVLRPAGSIYVHCDDSAVHYLRLFMNVIWGAAAFRNQIIWHRAKGYKKALHRWPRTLDHILFYAGRDAPFRVQWVAHSEDYIRATFRRDDGDGRGPYNITDIRDMSGSRRNFFEWRGYQPPHRGWAFTEAKMQDLHDQGRLHYPAHRDGTPDLTKRVGKKTYLAEVQGLQIQDHWGDIGGVKGGSAEHAEYPTQKPLAMLQRIIAASGVKDGVALDPFMGSGTTCLAAARAGMDFVGIDASADAVKLARERLEADGLPLFMDAPEIVDATGPGSA